MRSPLQPQKREPRRVKRALLSLLLPAALLAAPLAARAADCQFGVPIIADGSCTIPAGVTNVTIIAVGGGGAGASASNGAGFSPAVTANNSGNGGAGAQIVATMTVKTNDTINYTVGQGGTCGNDANISSSIAATIAAGNGVGGQGGGATWVSTNEATDTLIAGGGGGGGAADTIRFNAGTPPAGQPGTNAGTTLASTCVTPPEAATGGLSSYDATLKGGNGSAIADGGGGGGSPAGNYGGSGTDVLLGTPATGYPGGTGGASCLQTGADALTVVSTATGAAGGTGETQTGITGGGGGTTQSTIDCTDGGNGYVILLSGSAPAAPDLLPAITVTPPNPNAGSSAGRGTGTAPATAIGNTVNSDINLTGGCTASTLTVYNVGGGSSSSAAQVEVDLPAGLVLGSSSTGSPVLPAGCTANATNTGFTCDTPVQGLVSGGSSAPVNFQVCVPSSGTSPTAAVPLTATTTDATDTNTSNNVAVVTIEAPPTTPDLAPTLTLATTTLTPGTPTTATLIVDNLSSVGGGTGTGDSTTATLTVTMPDGVFATALPTGGTTGVTCTVTGGSAPLITQFTCTLPTVALDDSVAVGDFPVVAPNPLPAPAAISTNVTATGDTDSGNDNDSVTVNTTSSGSCGPDLLSAWTVGNSVQLASGNSQAYQLTVTNQGTCASTATATETITIPANTTLDTSKLPTTGCSFVLPTSTTAGSITCTVPVLQPGDNENIPFTLTANVTIPANTPITPTLTQPTPDLKPGNDQTTPLLINPPWPDLTPTVTVSPTLTAGQNTTATLTVANINTTNGGKADSTGGTVTVTLPDGVYAVTVPTGCTVTGGTLPLATAFSCTLPAITLGGSDNVGNFTIIAPNNLPAAETITATVTAQPGDVYLANDTTPATVNTAASGTCGFDLVSAWTVGNSGTLNSGQSGNYQLTVTNQGSCPSTARQVTITIPANTTLDTSKLPTGCSFVLPTSTTAGSITCTVPALTPGGDENIPFTLTATGTIPANTPITPLVTTDTNDLNPDNDTTQPLYLNPQLPDLTPTVTVSPTLTAGQNTTATLTVANINTTNGGKADSTGGTVTVTLPDGVYAVTVPTGCTVTGGTLPLATAFSCTLPAITLGGSDNLGNFTIIVPNNLPAAETITATVTAQPGDVYLANDTTPATVDTVTRGSTCGPDMVTRWTKGASSTLTIGASGDYQLTVTNQGTCASTTGTTVTITVPVNTTISNIPATCTTVVQPTAAIVGSITCTVPVLTPGGDVNIPFTLTAIDTVPANSPITPALTSLSNDLNTGNDNTTLLLLNPTSTGVAAVPTLGELGLALLALLLAAGAALRLRREPQA